jgi:3-dehydroquinate synthase
MESESNQTSRRQSNIVLTGFMGTGKSVAGHILARETGREFIDTDELIAQRAGKSIANIFFEDGEQTFRLYERQISRELSTKDGLVISTGGRLMLDPLNALLLNQNAAVFCLTATAEEILARTENDLSSRPLLDGDNPAARIEKLLREREEGYSQYKQINTGGRSIQDVVKDILTLTDTGKLDPTENRALRSSIPIHYPGGSYTTVVGRDLLKDLSRFIDLERPTAVITDSNVGKHYVNTLRYLGPAATIIVPAGEKYKRLETVRKIYDELLKGGIDRQGAIITLGGGVIGDMGGFAASTYMRGIRLVQCPTSLLAMVDASIGGKTGVDLPAGKNLVGAFKQPDCVIADLLTLRTLPLPELRSGMAEVIKAALIASPEMFDSLEKLAFSWSKQINDGHQLPLDNLQSLIVESILIKREFVERDPFEKNERMLLNLGHTFAHAIEKGSGYTIRHGEAVAVGLVAAAFLSASLGYFPDPLVIRIEQLLNKMGLPIRIPESVTVQQLMADMLYDKKMESGKRRFILMRDIGDVFVGRDVPETAVEQVIEYLRRS